MIAESRVVGDGEVFLLDSTLETEQPGVLFDDAHWREAGYLRPTAKGRGSAVFVGDADRAWVWRHFRRGGLLGRIVTDHYLFTGEDRVRSFAEWRLLARLTDMRLPVPVPVAARYRRRGLAYTADLITREIADAEPLSQWIEREWPQAEVWDAVGRCIRRFHDAGVDHADLNAHNILIGPQYQVHLIDFDKGAIRLPGRWAQRNLDRLRRSLVKITADEQAVAPRWQYLLAGYHQGASGEG